MQTSYNLSNLKAYTCELEQLETCIKQYMFQLETMGTGKELQYLKQQFQTMLYTIEKQKTIIYTLV